MGVNETRAAIVSTEAVEKMEPVSSFGYAGYAIGFDKQFILLTPLVRYPFLNLRNC